MKAEVKSNGRVVVSNGLLLSRYRLRALLPE